MLAEGSSCAKCTSSRTRADLPNPTEGFRHPATVSSPSRQGKIIPIRNDWDGGMDGPEDVFQHFSLNWDKTKISKYFTWMKTKERSDSKGQRLALQAQLRSPAQQIPPDPRGPSISILALSVPRFWFSPFAPAPEQAAGLVRSRQPAPQARCALQHYGWDAHGTRICISFFRFGLRPVRGMSSHCWLSLGRLQVLKNNLSFPPPPPPQIIP